MPRELAVGIVRSRVIMTQLNGAAATMERDSSDKVLSPRAALLVCGAAAIIGWLAVAGAVYVGKSLISGSRDMDVAGKNLSTVAPAAGKPDNAPTR